MPKHKTGNVASAFVVSLLFLSFASTPAIAQVTTGSILGTVHDSTGAVVPNATVTITDTAKGTISTKQTDASGDYNVPFLIPGTYTVSVEMPGSNAAFRVTSFWTSTRKPAWTSILKPAGPPKPFKSTLLPLYCVLIVQNLARSSASSKCKTCR